MVSVPANWLAIRRLTPLLSLLHQSENQRQADRLDEYEWTRKRLQAALRHHLPGQRVWLFGSLEPGRFHSASDVDLALAVESLVPGDEVHDIGGRNSFVSLALQKAGIDSVLVEPGSGARNAARRDAGRILHEPN